MSKDKNQPKSLKDQLAPLKAQLKAEEEKELKNQKDKKDAKNEAKGKNEKAAPLAQPAKASTPKTTPSTPNPNPGEKSDTTSDAEMVEFWRAAAGTVPISEGGRELHEPKKKPAPQTPGDTSKPVVATPSDKETFASLLDLSDNTMKQALYEKEGAKTVPVRAISSKRVELTGLSPLQAQERLLRFLKAARLRKEKVVLVVFGAEAGLREIVEETLDQVRGELVVNRSDAGEPMAFKVTLA